MRSDAIAAKAAERRQNREHDSAATPEPAMPRGPSVRSVVQRVSSADAEEDEQQDRRAAARYVMPRHACLIVCVTCLYLFDRVIAFGACTPLATNNVPSEAL